MKNSAYRFLCMSFLLILLFLMLGPVAFADNIITIYNNKNKGVINNLIFGNNLLGYGGDPTANYGAGIWNANTNEPDISAINYAKETKITAVRFPGGCGSHIYDWHQAIGKKRIDFRFGIDEFLKVTETLKAKSIYTLSYFVGDENTDADLVEYLNAPYDGTNPNGGREWAAVRAKNGHIEPYGVKYFEVGNEVEHGNHIDIKQVLPEEYAKKYLKYYITMKTVDPTIKIGAVLSTRNWNKLVLGTIKDKIDFGVIHIYPTPILGEEVSKIPSRDIFAITWAKAVIEVEPYIKEVLDSLKQDAGTDIPVAITEYNGCFVQDKPVPYRHCLGTALLNAELLKIFMKPESNVLMANYWDFCNEYWGMIANGFDGNPEKLNQPYYKRPNYYVFELYRQHFGDVLLDADAQSDTYEVKQYQYFNDWVKKSNVGTLMPGDLLQGKWRINIFFGVVSKEDDGLLEIDFDEPRQYNYFHSVKHAEIKPGKFYRLSGYIKTEHLVDSEGGVSLEVQDDRGWTQTHSAMSTDKVRGTTNWKYVEVVYCALPDASGVNVIARRVGDNGPLHGKAYFRDVKLEEFVPSDSIRIPYLSVNASKSGDGKKIYLIVINKNMDAAMTSTIDLRDFVPAGDGNAWILNGPSVDAINEVDHNNVKVTQKSFKIKSNPFEFTFEPHSLTAIEIDSAADIASQ